MAYGLTVNLECVVDLHLPRRLLAKDREHEEELVEALKWIGKELHTLWIQSNHKAYIYQAPRVVGGKHMADPLAEGILLQKRRERDCIIAGHFDLGE